MGVVSRGAAHGGEQHHGGTFRPNPPLTQKYMHPPPQSALQLAVQPSDKAAPPPKLTQALFPPMPCILPSVLTAKAVVVWPSCAAMAAAAALLAAPGPAPPNASSWLSAVYGCWPTACKACRQRHQQQSHRSHVTCDVDNIRINRHASHMRPMMPTGWVVYGHWLLVMDSVWVSVANRSCIAKGLRTPQRSTAQAVVGLLEVLVHSHHRFE
jgi:hypothetical protein